MLSLRRANPREPRPIAATCADMILLRSRRGELYCDAPPARVRILFRIVAEGIEMADVFTDSSEGFLLAFPVLGKVNFATRGFGHALKHSSRNWILPGFVGAD